MCKLYKLSVLLAVLCCFQSARAQEINYSDSWGSQGFTLETQKSNGVSINYSLTGISLEDVAINGESLKSVKVSGIFLPNDEGAPDLAGTGRFIAIPLGATATVKVIASRTETIKDVNIAPAPRIPLDTDDGPLFYEKNQKIFSKNAFYPEEPVKLSEQMKLRGVDVVILGITPFQYNPVTKELIIYRDLKIEVTFEGGSGYVGEDRLRSRWWDPIIQDAVINPAFIPEIDYSKKSGSAKTPDYEYVIIIPNDPVFVQWADTIKNWRTLQGIKTGIVKTTDIGGNTVAAIEAYVDNAYNTWDIPPAAVLLLGDYGTGTAGINSHLYTHPAGYPDFASDNKYADVNGDELPDIAFARITANNASQLQVMISKFLNNERNPPTDPNFYNYPITALGWQTERWFQICSEVVGGFWKNVQGKNPVRINAIYSGTPGSVWSTATNTQQVVDYFGPSGLGYIPTLPSTLGGWSGGTPSDVVNAINNGSFMLQHRDHGFYEGWGEPAFTSTYISSLTNVNNKLPFVFSINCQTGAYHNTSECFAEKFHRYTYGGQNSGALGLIAATEVSYSFVNDAYVWGLFDNLWTNFMPAYGTNPASRDILPAFGNSAGKNFLYQTSWPYNTGDKLVTYRLFHHHGDAFMTVYSEVPQNLTVNHATALLGGTSSFTVTANSGSFIALTVNGEIIATANGTGSPVVMTIAPQTPGSNMIVTITKQNYFRYSATVAIIPPTGPYVSYESHSLNDQSGNNNGLADFGESILLNTTVKNLGSETANNVTALLICSDPFITLSDPNQNYGTIAAGASSTINGSFGFNVASNVPDGHVYNFELQVSGSTDDIWTSYFSITANAPLLDPSVGLTINDATGGNGNGRLDPGETATITAVVENNGHSLSPSVSAVLTTVSPYITINAGSDALGQIAAGGSASADFNITCSASTPVGQSVDLAMAVDAGNYGFNHTYYASVGLVLEDWELGNFTRFPWTFSGNANWTIANTGQYEGLYTAKSGVITHSQTSDMSVMLQVTTAGNIYFYRKTSSEASYDYLKFFIDGVQQGLWAGEVAWSQVSYPVTAGIHTFKWTYSKDGSVSTGSDCAWVDYIIFPPSVIVAPEIVVNPLSFNVTVAPDEIFTTPLTISNTGNLNLTWSASTAINTKDGGKAYCTASGGCDEYLSSVSFNTLTNASGACSSGGYADYTAMSTTVEPGMSYNFSYVIGTYYTPDDIGVWIDWNQNEVFTDAGENVVCAYNVTTTGSYSISVPENALSGPTRMRVRLKYSGDDCGSSCGTATYGEVEDYTVIVDGANKWLTIAPGSGTITQGNNQNPTVTFDATGLSDGIYTGQITVNSNDADEGQIVIPCTMNVSNGFTVNLTAMLEGPFSGSEMNTDINGILPLNQPYNAEPWNYSGTESVGVMPANAVDWVLVELRDATTAANANVGTRIARQAGLLLNNGNIVSTDGSQMFFAATVSNNLFLVVHHRSHLGILSAYPLTFSAGSYSYNFSTSATQAYGVSPQKQLASGVWGMLGGDADCNGEIMPADIITIWKNSSGKTGYLMGDFNLNGQVDNADKDDCWFSNYGKVCQVP